MGGSLSSPGSAQRGNVPSWGFPVTLSITIDPQSMDVTYSGWTPGTWSTLRIAASTANAVEFPVRDFDFDGGVSSLTMSWSDFKTEFGVLAGWGSTEPLAARNVGFRLFMYSN